MSAGIFGTEPIAELSSLASSAEDLGYSRVWIGDSQVIWREALVTIGVLAAKTRSLSLGTGVSNIRTRHLSVLASAWVSLTELIGTDRVALGLGLGDSSLRTIGLKPSRFADIELAVARLRALFAGEEVCDPTTSAHFRLTYGVPTQVPIYIAGSAPRLLQLAGRIADGVIMLVGVESSFIEAGLNAVRAGARESGRSLQDIHIVLWTPTAVQADGRLARDLVRAHVARIVIRPLPSEVSTTTRSAIEKIRQAYDYYQHMLPGAAHAELVPDALVDHFALAGTPSECHMRLDALSKTGVDEVAIVPYAPEVTGRRSVLEAISHEKRRLC